MIYHHQKIFLWTKVIKVLSERALFKFLSVDISSRLLVIGPFVGFSVMSVFFRFLSEWVFFRFFSDSVLFESSVFGASSGSSVIDFLSEFISPLFRYAAILLLKCAPLFLLWANLLFYVIFSKRHSLLTISSTCFEKLKKTTTTKEKTDSEEHEKIPPW